MSDRITEAREALSEWVDHNKGLINSGAKWPREVAALRALIEPPADDERETLAEHIRSIFRDAKYGRDLEWVRLNVLGSLDRFRALADVAQPSAEWEAALNLLADVVVRAVPDGEDDDGFVQGYVQGTGSIHAAIPFLDRYGLHVRPGYDFRNDAKFSGIKTPAGFRRQGPVTEPDWADIRRLAKAAGWISDSTQTAYIHGWRAALEAARATR